MRIIDVQTAVAAHYGMSRELLVGRGQPKELATIRYMAMYLARLKTGRSYPQLGKAFNRHHSVVMDGIKNIRERIEYEDDLATDWARLKRSLRNGQDTIRGGAESSVSGNSENILRRNPPTAEGVDSVGDRVEDSRGASRDGNRLVSNVFARQTNRRSGAVANNGSGLLHVEVADPVVEAVRADLLRRSQVGIAKYGVTLARTDLDELAWLNYLYEELLDAANYTKRRIMDLEQRVSDASDWSQEIRDGI